VKASELYGDIRKYFMANANKAMVKKYERYFTEGYDAYGIIREKFDKKLKDVKKDKSLNMRLVLSTSKLLVKSGKYEETNFAICLLKEFSAQFDHKTFGQVEKWFDIGIVNWAHTDVFCEHLMSEFFGKEIISLKDISDWRSAKNTYQRRAVPVSMLSLLKTTKSYKSLFGFIEPLMMDGEKKVQQGLGWFLREAWKIKKKETETFLLKWKDKAPRIIFQYATEKMTAEEKKRFRKEKTTSGRRS
jgi:3-methyladenine DNA glycosylase AlkD